MKKFIFTGFLLMSLVPASVFAQINNNQNIPSNNNINNSSLNNDLSGNQTCDDNIENISDLLNLAGCIIISALIPLLITLSVIIFIIGIIKYIAGADDSAKREDGQKFMLYGIIALFVMISIWGLVGILQGTFGLGNTVVIPQMQGL